MSVSKLDDKALDQLFIESMNAMGDRIHAMAMEKGWWEPPEDLAADLTEVERCGFECVAGPLRNSEAWHRLKARLTDRNDGEMLALFHSELSEALEGLRHGNPPSDKIGDQGFSQAEEELADLFVRVLDTCRARGWRVAEALVAKVAYNGGREYRHGNKAF